MSREDQLNTLLPPYEDETEKFTASRQREAWSLLRDWSLIPRLRDDKQTHKAFTRLVCRNEASVEAGAFELCEDLWQDARMTEIFPDNTPVRQLLIDRAGVVMGVPLDKEDSRLSELTSLTCRALTIVMTEAHDQLITPVDFRAIQAGEIYLEQKGLVTP